MIRRLRLLAAAAALAAAQRGPAAPACAYCGDDPKVLAATGLVGHGSMPFAKSTSDDVKKFLSYMEPIFLETKRFRIGSTLEAFNVPEKDWKKVGAELADLRKRGLTNVPLKAKRIDPWLRLHLYAVRAEKLYDRFLEIVRVPDAEFAAPRGLGAAYRGEGPYMGMKMKHEIFLHKDVRAHTDLCREYMGSAQLMPKRWHYVDRGIITVSLPGINELRADDNLHASLAHNLAHNFVCAFKHYSYEPPKWIEEGLAHWFEKIVSDDFNSFDSEEAAIGEMYAGKDWRTGTLRMLADGKAAATAELVYRKSLSEITKEDHVITWSKIDFMLQAHPEKFARFLGGVKGRLNPMGFPDGSNLVAAQRDVMREVFGWTFAEFDQEWEKWVRVKYVEKTR